MRYGGVLSRGLTSHKPAEPLEFGFALTRRGWLEVKVNAEYRISEFERSKARPNGRILLGAGEYRWSHWHIAKHQTRTGCEDRGFDCGTE